MTAPLADLTDDRFTAEQRAKLAEFDAAPVPPEVAVETVARAMEDACGDDATWLTLAAAAIAALPPSPAEEAVRRVEAVAAELQGEADSRSDDSLASVAERSGLLIAVTRLREVLESPALPPSPAEEAVKRVEAVLVAAGPAPRPGKSWTVEVEAVRAALASPAPAPQGEEGER